MKPGPMPWATSDTYAAGPDIGSSNKLEPGATEQTDGLYAGYQVGPDTINWVLNRLHHLQRSVARLQALNYELTVTDTTDYQGGSLLASCHNVMTAGQRNIWLFYSDVAIGSIKEMHSSDGGQTWDTPASSPVTAVALGLLDADGDESTRRIVTNDGGNDLVRYNTLTGGATWATIVFTAGAPGLNWRAVGCDRNTAGGAAAMWCIGDDAGGGSSVLWTSADGINFAVEAGWPGATVTEPIRGIFHSCHPVDGLGPSDPGNPHWLVVSDTYTTRSVDGAVWIETAHALALGGGTLHRRSAAYSRTTGRWVIALPAATGGDIAYSDDLGVSWTTLASALPAFGGAGFEPSICCDGYGTFLITTNAGEGGDTRCYISTDDGLTWTQLQLPSANYGVGAGGLDGVVCEAAVDEAAHADETSDAVTAFVIALYDDSGPETEIFRSLKV